MKVPTAKMRWAGRKIRIMRVPVREYLQLLSRYLRPQRKWAVLLGVLILAAIGLRLINPQILRTFIDAATGVADSRVPLAGLAVIFFGFAVATQGLVVASTYVGETVAWTATNALRLDLLRHCLRLDATFHKNHSAGRLIERIDGDVETLSNFFSKFLISVVGNVLLILGIVSMLFREDWRIGLPMGLFTVLTIVVLVAVRRLAIPYWTKYRRLTAKFFGFIGEQITGTEDIRANGAEPFVMGRFNALLAKLFPVRVQAGMRGYGMWMANVAAFALGTAVAFLVIFLLWQRGEISIGTAYLVFYYTQQLFSPINEIRNQITDLQRAEAGMRRIRELLDTQPVICDRGQEQLPSGALALEFDRVSFSYDGNGEGSRTDDEAMGIAKENGAEHRPTHALRHVSIRVDEGRTLGLLGRTGSGKSTFARLLVRLYDIGAGAIRLGGTPIDQVRLAELRHRVRLVPQEVQLFRASVRDNVRLFDPGIDDRQVLDALRHLDLEDWANALPDGLDTELGPGGEGLSAGQAQLIALARAFLADPGVVILDEASSRLDPITEGLLERAVDRLLEGRTGIVIAHRLTTIERADDILILEGGEVLEYGERRLLERDSSSHLAHLKRTGLQEVMA